VDFGRDVVAVGEVFAERHSLVSLAARAGKRRCASVRRRLPRC
jgi:hypothetical protein